MLSFPNLLLALHVYSPASVNEALEMRSSENVLEKTRTNKHYTTYMVPQIKNIFLGSLRKSTIWETQSSTLNFLTMTLLIKRHFTVI